MVAPFGCDTSHNRAFQRIAVAAATDHDNKVVTFVANFVDGVNDILQSVGSVCVIHNGGDSVVVNVLEAAGCGVQAASHTQSLVFVNAAQYGSGHNGCDVVGVEATHQLCPHLFAVDFQLLPVDGVFDDFAAEVGNGLKAIAFYVGIAVLHHHAAVAVVDVGEGESVFG